MMQEEEFHYGQTTGKDNGSINKAAALVARQSDMNYHLNTVFSK